MYFYTYGSHCKQSADCPSSTCSRACVVETSVRHTPPVRSLLLWQRTATETRKWPGERTFPVRRWGRSTRKPKQHQPSFGEERRSKLKIADMTTSGACTVRGRTVKTRGKSLLSFCVVFIDRQSLVMWSNKVDLTDNVFSENIMSEIGHLYR